MTFHSWYKIQKFRGQEEGDWPNKSHRASLKKAWDDLKKIGVPEFQIQQTFDTLFCALEDQYAGPRS